MLKNKNLEIRTKLIPRIGSQTYEALCITTDNRIIARGISDGKIYQIDDKFNLIAILESSGIFTLESKGLLLGSGTLLIYNQGKIYR